MSATDSATDLYAESIDRLRARDRVSPVERLRRETFALLGQIPPARNEGEVEAALPALRSALERSLAVALALLDHSGERGRVDPGRYRRPPRRSCSLPMGAILGRLRTPSSPAAWSGRYADLAKRPRSQKADQIPMNSDFYDLGKL
jgi:hypothetical protein